ncbi:MAG: hypothetical protein N2442_05005 [Spirochaetes bacterium]|nr:hypothetical protein [Spirochaetota bacterium]
MDDKQRRYGLFIYIIILIGYIGLFPIPLGKELLLVLQWIHPVDAPLSTMGQRSPTSKERVTGFLLGKTIGYVSETGDLLYRESVLYSALVTDRGFINYSAIPKNLVVKDPLGNILSTLQLEGYPFARKDRFFVLAADGCGVTEVTLEGEILWKRDFNQLITSMDAGTDTAAIGLWDGTLLVIGAKGEVVFQEKLSPDPYSVLYLTSLTKDDRMMGVVCGLNPQRGILWEKTPVGYKRVRSFQLNSDFRRPIQGLLDSRTGKFVMEDAEGLSIVGRGKESDRKVLLRERIETIATSPIDKLLLFSTQQDEGRKVYGITDTGKRVFLKSLDVQGPFWFQSEEGKFFLGFKKKIIKYQVKLG